MIVADIKVDGLPVAQPRPRVYRDKAGNVRAVSGNARVNQWKKLIESAVAEQYQGETVEGPSTLKVLFVLPRPKRLMRKKDPDRPIRHDRRPDLDNLVKAVKDSLRAAGVWKDDSQVCRLLAHKVYGSKQGESGARIVVLAWTGDPWRRKQ